MSWIDFKYDGIRLRIDTVNPLLLQRWRDYNIKGGDWEECHIYGKGMGRYINIGGRTTAIEKIVYKAHNPNWSTHYSKHNTIIFKDGDWEDFSIENLMIKDTGGRRRY